MKIYENQLKIYEKATWGLHGTVERTYSLPRPTWAPHAFSQHHLRGPWASCEIQRFCQAHVMAIRHAVAWLAIRLAFVWIG